MRFAIAVPSFTIATLFGTVVACSDGVSSSPTKLTPPPDAAVIVPPTQPARGPITVIVKGNGHVAASDGSFDCGESGGLDGGTCQPPHYGVTLYAAGYLPWTFDHWEPSMSRDASLQLQSWTADPITAVFVEIPGFGGVGGDGGGD